LQKIIQEEIDNISAPTAEQDAIQLLISYRDQMLNSGLEEPNNKTLLARLKKDLKSIMPDKNMVQALKSLEGKVDPQLYAFFLDALKKGHGAKVKSGLNISNVDRNNPDPGFMRVPKDDAAYDQEDVRKGVKNLVHEILDQNKTSVLKDFLLENGFTEKQINRALVALSLPEPQSRHLQDVDTMVINNKLPVRLLSAMLDAHVNKGK
jgi:hypothetical protein